MQKYWFTLYPYIFLWVKGEDGLIYNSLNHLSFSFRIFDKVQEICNELLSMESLYTTKITDANMMDNKVQEWIQSVINIKGGFLTYKSEMNPVSLKPVLKIQDDIKYYIWKHNQGIGGDIIQNLHQLTFYINGSEHGNNSYFRQTIFPLIKCEELNAKKIMTFIQNCRNPYLSHINIVGNIFSYTEFSELMDGLDELSIPYTIYITLKDFIQNQKQINETYGQFNILFDTLPDEPINLQSIKTKMKTSLLVFSQNDFLKVSEKYDKLPIYCDARIIPVYTGENIDFFESIVFTNRKDIDNMTLSKREIFIRQALNIHNFGKLTVMPNGMVYANVNHKQLGTINDTAYSLVYKEFIEGKSWFQIRNIVPCTNCVYQWLCPSLSNYETVIGKPNLCNVK